MCTSGLAAAILDLRLLVTFERLQISRIEFSVSENMGMTFGMALPSCIEADMRFIISVRHLECTTSGSTQQSAR